MSCLVGFTAFGSPLDCQNQKDWCGERLEKDTQTQESLDVVLAVGAQGETVRAAGDQAAEGPDGSARRSGGGGLKRQRRALREENRSQGYPILTQPGSMCKEERWGDGTCEGREVRRVTGEV